METAMLKMEDAVSYGAVSERRAPIYGLRSYQWIQRKPLQLRTGHKTSQFGQQGRIEYRTWKDMLPLLGKSLLRKLR